jgi:hypothetical protein
MRVRQLLKLLCIAAMICASAAVAADGPPIPLPFGFTLSRELSLSTLVGQGILLWAVLRHAGSWGRRLLQSMQQLPELKETVEAHVKDDKQIWADIRQSNNELRHAIEALRVVDQQHADALREHQINGEIWRREFMVKVEELKRLREGGHS